MQLQFQHSRWLLCRTSQTPMWQTALLPQKQSARNDGPQRSRLDVLLAELVVLNAMRQNRAASDACQWDALVEAIVINWLHQKGHRQHESFSQAASQSCQSMLTPANRRSKCSICSAQKQLSSWPVHLTVVSGPSTYREPREPIRQSGMPVLP